MNNYKVEIIYSEEDCCFIARVPELQGCITHGKDRIEALKNIEDVIDIWIDTAKSDKMFIPHPDVIKDKVLKEYKNEE
jgi:predicted RNase H-like HicB family nuclease